MKISITDLSVDLNSDLLVPVNDIESLKSYAPNLGISQKSIERLITDTELSNQFLINQNGNFVGLYKVKEAKSKQDHIQATWKMISSKGKSLQKKISIDLKLLTDKAALVMAETLCHSLILAQYNIGLYKSEPEKTFQLDTIQIFCNPSIASQIQEASEKGRIAAETRVRIMDLMNAPGNKLRPEDLANWALASGKEFGYQVEVLEMDAIREKGLGALIAVNRGSEWPARFIVAEYKGSDQAKCTFALVGKGVTFDTGGLSIKGNQNMHYMKSDMGGAAAVLGATEFIVRLGLPVHLVTIVPTTDNCVDAKAVKPGDVITGYSGKSIEIIDTDAEGRLILSDALAYAVKNYKPDVMIDAATLTGSAVRTLGYEAGALFSSNKSLSNALFEAGEHTGEKLWPLPMYQSYLEDMKSDVADIKNLSAKPLAGASTAAKFLEFFTDDHPAWAHLDIAGVAFGDTPASPAKNGTGYGIMLLEEFIRNWEENA